MLIVLCETSLKARIDTHCYILANLTVSYHKVQLKILLTPGSSSPQADR